MPARVCEACAYASVVAATAMRASGTRGGFRRRAERRNSALDLQAEVARVDDIWIRIIENISGRVSGPMKFRLILQPAMACYFAFRAGVSDARAHKPPYFWALWTDREHRLDMLRDGWKGVGKVFGLALVLDAVYQVIVLKFVYPGEALLVGIGLAIVPYLVVRALVNRVLSR